MALQIAIGAFVAAALILTARRASWLDELRVYGFGLIVAALVYVALGLSGDAGGREVAVELLGVAVFSAIAFLGLRFEPSWLAAGWSVHVLWDLVLHGAGTAVYVPGWYPMLCVGFDLLLAGYILGLRLG